MGEIEVPRPFDDRDEKDSVVFRELYRFNDASKKGHKGVCLCYICL